MAPICIDFDGTCVDHAYPDVGRDAPHAVRVLRILSGRYKLILNTMRCGAYLDAALDWFRENDIPLYGINHNPDQSEWTDSPKAWGLIYIDDCGFGCPLVYVRGFNRPVVDWLAVERELCS